MKSINLLILTGDLKYCCGVSSSIYNLIRELVKYSELRITLLSTGGDAEDKFRDLCQRHASANFELITDNNFSHGKRYGTGFLRSIIKLRRLVKQKKINIIHSHNHYAANLAYFSSKGKKNITLIQTNHGLIPNVGKLKHFIADKYIAVNDQILNYIVQNKIADKDNVELIRCGISVQDNGSISERSQEDSIKIFTASRIVKEKGLETLIRAASYLKNNFPDKKFNFEIAGEGDDTNELMKLNTELNAGVKFLGVVSNIISKLRGIDFFVITSHSEGFPISMIEAGLSKRLIISSRFEGLNYVFQDNQDGFTFEINNHAELAEKILLAANNPDLTNKLAMNFHEKVIKLFNPETTAERHLNLYEKALKNE